MKNVYILSDAHLGSLAIDHSRMHERRLVRFLDDIKHKASAIYLLGDMFDFWYEYKYVVPKGYTRFLGKLSELTDMGVEVHYFTGNHDIWMYGYLEEECGVILHKKPETVDIYGKVFYLAHGDGLGDPDSRFKFIRKVFHNRFCQHLFSSLHPRWGMWFGLEWARRSRMKRADGKEPPYMGQGVYEDPSQHRLFRVWSSPYRTRPHALAQGAYDDFGRLDMAVLLCGIRRGAYLP